MTYIAIVGLLLAMPSIHAENNCESFRKIISETETLIPSYSTIAVCSRFCLARQKCSSIYAGITICKCHFNNKTLGTFSSNLRKGTDNTFADIFSFHENDNACLNHTCPMNTYCDPVNKTHYVCRVTSCLGTPTVENGHFKHAPEESPLGAVLALTSDPGYMCKDGAVCQDNGTWSSPVCVSVSSCGMVKHYQPDSEDGEYWLRLTNFDNYTTRIYCHDMSTTSPKHFLTLSNINYGVYPRVMNTYCKKETELKRDCTGQGGEIWFNKIKVNIETMKVYRADRTFANISHSEKFLYYATAVDCYTHHRNNSVRCGTKGRFTIDLRGTGWRVGEDQKWRTFMYHAMIEGIERQFNGTLIKLRCGGLPGSCIPTKGLFLIPIS